MSLARGFWLSLLQISPEEADKWSAESRLYMPCLTGVNASKFLNTGFQIRLDPFQRKRVDNTGRNPWVLPFVMNSSSRDAALSATTDFPGDLRKNQTSSGHTSSPSGPMIKENDGAAYCGRPAGVCATVQSRAKVLCARKSTRAGMQPLRCREATKKHPHMSGATPSGRQR